MIPGVFSPKMPSKNTFKSSDREKLRAQINEYFSQNPNKKGKKFPNFIVSPTNAG